MTLVRLITLTALVGLLAVRGSVDGADDPRVEPLPTPEEGPKIEPLATEVDGAAATIQRTREPAQTGGALLATMGGGGDATTTLDEADAALFGEVSASSAAPAHVIEAASWHQSLGCLRVTGSTPASAAAAAAAVAAVAASDGGTAAATADLDGGDGSFLSEDGSDDGAREDTMARITAVPVTAEQHCELAAALAANTLTQGMINAENLEIVELGVASDGTLHAVAANMSTSALPQVVLGTLDPSTGKFSIGATVGAAGSSPSRIYRGTCHFDKQKKEWWSLMEYADEDFSRLLHIDAATGAVLDDYSFEDNWHDWDPYGCLKLE